jgi:2-iminobutanoate/2-iminopropanoate deaminase
MPRDALFPDGLVRPKAPYSPAVRAGDLVYTAGQVGFDADGALVAGGVAEQTRQALANLELCLGAAGCTLGDVVKVNVFLADLGDFEAFNAAYRESFEAPFPARTTVQAGLPGEMRVEIEAVARAETVPGAGAPAGS